MAPVYSLHPPFSDVVLPNAAVRTPRGGIADGVELPAVVGVTAPFSTPIDRCSPAGRLAVLAALALGNTPPPPIAASSTCARALTCLLQALEREQTWETMAHLLL